MTIMNAVSQSDLANRPSVLFSGTGEDGKVKVLIAKTKERAPLFDEFKQRDDLEVIEEVATTPGALRRIVQEEQPDVIIAGSIFGHLGMSSPLATIKELLKEGVIDNVGIVVNSSSTPEWISTICTFVGGNPEPVGFTHVPGVAVDSDALAQAAKEVDPHREQFSTFA